MEQWRPGLGIVTSSDELISWYHTQEEGLTGLGCILFLPLPPSQASSCGFIFLLPTPTLHSPPIKDILLFYETPHFRSESKSSWLYLSFGNSEGLVDELRLFWGAERDSSVFPSLRWKIRTHLIF